MKRGQRLVWGRRGAALCTSYLLAALGGGCSASDVPGSSPEDGAGGPRSDDAAPQVIDPPARDAAAPLDAASIPSSRDASSAPVEASTDGRPEAASVPRDAAAVVADAGVRDANPAAAGVFVAVGYGGRTTRSIDDGRTWIDDTSLAARGGDDNDLLRTVLWGGGQFVALGWRVLTSTDGRIWKAQGGVMSQWIGAAVYQSGIYAAVGGYGLRSTSTDAVTWTAHAIDQTASHAHGGLAYGDVLGGRFVATNDDGRRSYATNGADWKYSTGAATVVTTALAYGKGVFVGVGGDQTVLSTDGGITWTLGARLAAPADALIFADGHFTALGAGHALTSNDGTTWQDHAVSGLLGGAVAYGHGTYVLVVDTSFRRSSDGVTWSPAVQTGGNNPYEWIAFGVP